MKSSRPPATTISEVMRKTGSYLKSGRTNATIERKSNGEYMVYDGDSYVYIGESESIAVERFLEADAQ